jgi:hypothetical protein
MNKKTNTINIFEIVSRINDDFGNLVYNPHSFPSIDIKFDGNAENNEIYLETSDMTYQEAPRSVLKIIWNKNDKTPNYNVHGYSFKIIDGKTDRYDYFIYDTTDIFKVVEQVLKSINNDDEPTGDDDADNWESGLNPDDYIEQCRSKRKGIFQGLNSKTKLGMPWF